MLCEHANVFIVPTGGADKIRYTNVKKKCMGHKQLYRKNENNLDGVKMNKKSEFYDRSGILCYLKGKM